MSKFSTRRRNITDMLDSARAVPHTTVNGVLTSSNIRMYECTIYYDDYDPSNGIISERYRGNKLIRQRYVKDNVHHYVRYIENNDRNYKSDHVVYFNELGLMEREEFYVDGVLHFEDRFFDDARPGRRSPDTKYTAVIYFDNLGNEISTERWYKGKRLPSLKVEYNEHKQLVSKTWHIDGNTHQDNGDPAYTVYDPATGVVLMEEWKQHGKYCRWYNRPDRIEYTRTGAIYKITWYNEAGEIHRDGDAPAVIYYVNGVADRERYEYWLNGVKVRG